MDNIIKKIKENLGLLVLIPSLLGGGWQVFELYSIDPFLIRLFSISQAISDGLIILTFISCPIVLLFLLFSFIKVFGKSEIEEEKSTFDDTKKGAMVRLITTNLTVLLFTLFFRSFFFPLDIDYPTLFMFSLYTLLLMLNVSWTLNSLRINNLIKVSEVRVNDISKKSTIVILTISFFYVLTQIYIHSKDYSKIGNISLINPLLKKNAIKHYRIRYYNDKYIFIEELLTKKIYIIDFNSIILK